MFDLAWSEIALIGVVALVVIGPKDLPEAIRGIARGIAKLRRMASEFQGQADELVREANLDEVRQSINEIRRFNVRDELTRAVDKDGSIRKTFTEDPLKPSYTPPPAPTPAPAAESFGPPAPEPPRPAAPAFIPPGAVPTAAAPPAPPAFVPPADPAPAQPPQQS
ncbi:twin-arginine translocase subunit TatB [Belnapia sp. T18]|uniref:Sec-independent protein translocase protein TatB n=1 Tax=Belnapia arida TaxID=2804533 RepID=A0ABS1TZ52_9PROT|nr:Sec-independent protein translocase protein TatB [Belnapia arida]MBL6077699.1 twin-arginine translocase subunit TatB [Belnapia arida]